MKSLREVLKEAEENAIAIGHFNISDLLTLKAIMEAAVELKAPVVIGTSEGERNFIGPKQAAAEVRSLREENGHPVFLNADHTHSLAKIQEAVEAGYDAVLFDGSKLSFEENIRQTKEVVNYVKSVNSEILVEGELGYIGSSSEVLTEIPAGAALEPGDLTSPEEAKVFVEETGVDLFAPAVGNIHGIVVKEGFREQLNIERIRAIREAVGVPLVLHGASGLSREDLLAAIKAGISLIHISTELRVAWRKGIEEGLKNSPDEVAPYKIYPPALRGIKKITQDRMRLFSGKQD